LFAGGEFYYDERWVSDQPALSTQNMLFLNGGSACLTVLCAALRDRGIQRLLLPSYLCPSILNTLDRAEMGVEFYKVHSDLSIDLADLAQKASHHQGIYFINYFGFQPAPPALQLLQDLQRSGLILIEDNAQAGFSRSAFGDFVFNSLRKFVPYDGGYLSARQDLAPYVERYRGRINRRLAVIRQYRRELGDYLLAGQGSHAALEALFGLSEQYYIADGVVAGDPLEREAIEHLDWAGIQQIRRSHYEYALGFLASIPEVTPLFPALQASNMPMGLPVTLSGVSRDQVCQELGRAAVGLSIHWDDILTDERLNRDMQAVDLASRILTLVIDQRTSFKQIDYQIFQLKRAIAAVR
jgi:hypothetical protein